MQVKSTRNTENTKGIKQDQIKINHVDQTKSINKDQIKVNNGHIIRNDNQNNHFKNCQINYEIKHRP